jgi:hypothetical protein
VWTAERMYSQARALIPNEEGNLELGKLNFAPLSEGADASRDPNVQFAPSLLHSSCTARNFAHHYISFF